MFMLPIGYRTRWVRRWSSVYFITDKLLTLYIYLMAINIHIQNVTITITTYPLLIFSFIFRPKR
jgi:hypothetical protein